jgi:spermidine synthase
MLPAASKTKGKKVSQRPKPPVAKQKPAPVQNRSPAWPRLVLLLFFFASGGCGLIYQVVWSRMLVLVLGNTTLAATTILAAFMAGLALGSHYWGRSISYRPRDALPVFGRLEILTGIFALIFPFLLKLLPPAEVWLSGGGGGHSQVALRFGLTFFLLLAPTFLMGGTLAVLGQAFIVDRAGFGPGAALLYGINTLGAVIGAFLAGFFLIKYLGHNGSLFLAASVNLAVGGGSLLLARHGAWSRAADSTPAKGRRAKRERRVTATVYWLVLVGIGLSGFCTLAYEVLWTRLLILVADNSVYSFTAILMAILSGLALGSLILAPLFRRIGNPLPYLALAEVGLGLSAFCLPWFIELGPIDRDLPYWQFLLAKMPLFTLVPAIFAGAALPLAADICRSRRDQTGRSLGAAWAANTLGGVGGAVAAGFFLIPTMGFHSSSLLLPAINLAVGSILLAVWLRGRLALIPITAAVLLAALGWRLMPPDFFALKYAQLEPSGNMVYYDEGQAATVSIFDRPDASTVLFLNGIPEVDNSQDSLRTFKLMGILPGLLHPQPSRALMVTFGAGITSSAATLFSDRVDCVDLVEQYRAIATHFSSANGQVLARPGLTMHIDDARHFLATNQRRYSIIISDATHPRSYDSWVLFTSEFYELVKTRLEEDGIFCQWAPFHGLSPDLYLSLVRTFSQAFPHTSIWNIGGAYSLLVATPQPLAVDFNRLTERLGDNYIRSQLRSVDLAGPLDVLSHFLMGEDNVKKLCSQAPWLIRDNQPAQLFFPFQASLREQYETWPLENYRTVRKLKESVVPYLTNVGRSDLERSKIMDVVRMMEMRQP